MIPKTADPLLTWLRSHAEKHRLPPSTDEIYAAVNFYEPGGILRLTTALRELAVTHVATPPLAERIVNSVCADHLSKGDGDGLALICVTRVELRRSVQKALP